MKRWIMQSKRAAFVVEHDFIMATYLADKVIVFDGEPAKETWCTSPETLVTGMNKFLKLLDITFRRDPTNYRPRINKHESQKDQEQKKGGNYFLMEETKEQQAERLAKQAAADKEWFEAQKEKGKIEESKEVVANLDDMPEKKKGKKADPPKKQQEEVKAAPVKGKKAAKK